MKKELFATMVAILLSQCVAFAGQIAEIPFVPLSPAVMGRGDCAIATAQGYDAFFYNPAGFSRGNGEFMLTSATSWVYARPDQLIWQGVQLALGRSNPTATFNFLNSQITTGGFGAGSAIGIGVVKGGFGLGAALILDSLLYGQTMLGMMGDLTATLGLIGGLSVPLYIGGMRIDVGGDLRPMIRIHAPIQNDSAIALTNAIANGTDIAAALSSATAVYGSAVGLDLGLPLGRRGGFLFGLSIRDVGGTTFAYSQNTLGSVAGSLASQGSLPPAARRLIRMSSQWTSVWASVSIPTSALSDISLISGSAWIFAILSGFFRAASSSGLAFTLERSCKLFNLFVLRGGINPGYLTAGGGWKSLSLT